MLAKELSVGEAFYIADHLLGHTLGFVVVEHRPDDVVIRVDRLNRDVMAAIPKDTKVHRIFEYKEICIECGSDEDVRQSQCVDCRVSE